MAEVTRNTKVAIVEQDARGTLKAPSANSDMVSIQDDFSMVGENDLLENAELTGNTMPAASILGVENVTGSFSHYIAHSGTEGAAPTALNVGIKNAFGLEAVAGAELSLAAGSTTTVLKYADTSSLQAGEALLIKDSANGWSLRTIASVDSGTDVTLSFALANAPAATTATGKACLYYPASAETDYNYLSVFRYGGNGGVLQACQDARVGSMDLSFTSNDFLNASFNFEGVKEFLNPIITGASTYQLQFTDDDLTDELISLTQKAWRHPHELADAIASAMNATATTETHTVVYSDSTGKFTFENTTGATLELDWSSGANSIATLIGFDTGADDTGALTYTSDTAQDLSSSYSAVSRTPLVCKNHEIFIGASSQSACTDSVNSGSFSLTNTFSNEDAVCEETGRAGKTVIEKTATIELDVLLSRYDADNFKRMKDNTTTSFLYNFGTQDSNGFEAGKSGCLYVRYAKITAHEIGDRDGLVNVNLSIQAFSDSGNDSVFFNLV